MMALRQPLFQNADVDDQTADLFRLWLRDMLNQQPGILQENAFEVIQRGAGANNSVDVRAGGIIAPGTQSGLQGYYYFSNDATLNLVMSSSHGTLPRIDTVIVHAKDSFYSGILNEGAIEYVPGVAASSPQPPDLDTLGYVNYWQLAQISVPANDNIINTSQISDLRLSAPGQARATTAGSPITCTSITRPINPRRGQWIFETNTGVSYIWNGTSWRVFMSVGNWTAYTPTFGGFFTVPSSRYGRYARIGNTIIVEAGCIIAQSPLATMTVSLPIPAVNPGNGTRYTGAIRSNMAAGRFAAIGIVTPSTDNSHLRNFATFGTQAWGPAVPANWVAGDNFDVYIAYEA